MMKQSLITAAIAVAFALAGVACAQKQPAPIVESAPPVTVSTAPAAPAPAAEPPVAAAPAPAVTTTESTTVASAPAAPAETAQASAPEPRADRN